MNQKMQETLHVFIHEMWEESKYKILNLAREFNKTAEWKIDNTQYIALLYLSNYIKCNF